MVADCEVEVLLVGAPHGQGRLTGLPGLTAHLGVIEAYRPGAPVPVPLSAVPVSLSVCPNFVGSSAISGTPESELPPSAGAGREIPATDESVATRTFQKTATSTKFSIEEFIRFTLRWSSRSTTGEPSVLTHYLREEEGR
jgi:hypothetical protein